MLQRLLTTILLCTMLPLAAGAGIGLPDLGSRGLRLLNGTPEDAIGRSIVNELRRSNLIIDDPEITEYIQNLGSRLVAGSGNTQVQFDFFVVRDDTVNAFALPGGYIGVHSGLIARTGTESELASVLAHEVAHVTQRHIERRYQAGSGMNAKSLAILLGAIALAAAGADGDEVMGGLMLGQGMAIQEQINFTRSQEYEADRVGIEFLADAGFDPRGMVDFFGTMQRMQRIQNSRMPEFMSTHPLSLSRVTEAVQRAQKIKPVGPVTESRNYPLIKARLGVLSGADPLKFSVGDEDDAAFRYARGIALIENGSAESAVGIFHALLQEDDTIIAYHVGLGRALAASGHFVEAEHVLRQSLQLFPDNVPVGLALASALQRADKPQEGLKVLRDLFNRRDPEPEYIRTMAQVAAAAGETAESHYYMSEYYLRTGDLYSGRVQLQLAVDVAAAGSNERLQYQARLEEISKVLSEVRANEPRRGPQSPSRSR